MVGPIALLGGFLGGIEHRGAEDGFIRGLVGGLVFGSFILLGHKIAGTEAKAELTEPQVVLVILTTVVGACWARSAAASGRAARTSSRRARLRGRVADVAPASASALVTVLVVPAPAEAYVRHLDLSYDIDSPPAAAGAEPARRLSPAGARRGSRPVVVWVHGGGWQQGDKRNGIRRKAGSSPSAGYVLASVNYRLSGVAPPSGPFDPAADQVPGPPARRGGGDRLAPPARRPLRRRPAAHRAHGPLVGRARGRARRDRPALPAPAYGVPRRVIRGVVSLDTAALRRRPLAEPRRNEGARGIWSVFGTPEENAATGAWALASPLLHADRRDPPFLQVLAETARPGKVRESRRMARALGQGPRSVVRVALDHLAIERLLGVHARETRAVMRFLRSAG